MKKLEVLINESVNKYIRSIISEGAYTERLGTIEELLARMNDSRNDFIEKIQNKMDSINAIINDVNAIITKMHEAIMSRFNIQENQVTYADESLSEWAIYYQIGEFDESVDYYSELYDIMHSFLPKHDQYSDYPISDIITVSEDEYTGRIELKWDLYDIFKID